MSIQKRVLSLSKSLAKEGLENPTPEPSVCLDLLTSMGKEVPKLSVTALEESTDIVKTFSKALRSFKRHKRGSEGDWDEVITVSTKLLDNVKSSLSKHQLNTKKIQEVVSFEPGEPKTVAEYRARLVRHKKDMYKDPPCLPPRNVAVESSFCPLPKRTKETGYLSFTANDPDVKKLLKDFHPNRTPAEVLSSGAFGGTYFRPIISSVTNIQYKSQDVLNDTVEKSWIKGLPMNVLTSKTYRTDVNKYGVKCGGSLGMWESSGWITEVDPYGWFQWYCRFYRGRRCDDDARQISRWLKSAGPKGRFRSQLCNKILAARTTPEDTSISPVIRQTLLHWGLEIDEDVLAKHKKRVGA